MMPKEGQVQQHFIVIHTRDENVVHHPCLNKKIYIYLYIFVPLYVNLIIIFTPVRTYMLQNDLF